MNNPGALAFDSSGNLFVANQGNSTIEEFGSSGTGSVFATSASGVDNPYGLAVDSSGNVYVANYSNSSIEKFNPNGQGSTFTSTNLLLDPIGLAFDSTGNLYVANHGHGDILEFNSSGVGSLFASGLGNAVGIAIDVPEPSSFLLLGLGAMTLCAFLKRKRA